MTAFLRNCWYLAAWADEVPNHGVLARRLLDEPVMLFRDAAGMVHALFDRCPHRFVPLSKGKVTEHGVACGYHGLAFDGSGQCRLNPHGPVTQNMRVRSYPVIEAYRALWIWMGDAEQASPASLRDLSFLSDAPDSAFSKGYVCGQGHYELFVDNILDLTHADFLHPDTLGGGAFTRTRAKVAESDRGISAYWHCMNEIPSPLMRSLPGMADEGARVDSWTEVDWSAPAIMTLRSGAVPAGTPREGAGNVLNLHAMTPETARTTHYFFASTRDFAMDDEALNARVAETRNRIFSTEDKPMIDAQQDRMEGQDFWQLDPLLLKIDEGAVRVRRKLAAMIAAENGVRTAHD